MEILPQVQLFRCPCTSCSCPPHLWCNNLLGGRLPKGLRANILLKHPASAFSVCLFSLAEPSSSSPQTGPSFGLLGYAAASHPLQAPSDLLSHPYSPSKPPGSCCNATDTLQVIRDLLNCPYSPPSDFQLSISIGLLDSPHLGCGESESFGPLVPGPISGQLRHYRTILQ